MPDVKVVKPSKPNQNLGFSLFSLGCRHVNSAGGGGAARDKEQFTTCVNPSTRPPPPPPFPQNIRGEGWRDK